MSWLQPRRLESSAQVDSGMQLGGRRRGGGGAGLGQACWTLTAR